MALSKEFKDREARRTEASKPPPIDDRFIRRHIIPEIEKEIQTRATNGEDFVHWPVTDETKNYLVQHFEATGFKCQIHFSPEEFYPETGWMPATETLIISWS